MAERERPVGYLAVFRVRGAGWDRSRGLREQAAWDEHAAFMEGLVADGFVRMGGPLGEGERVLLVVEAASEAAVRERLAADPWTGMGLLEVEAVERWQVLLGRPGG